MEKYCVQCGKLFEKSKSTSLKDWETRKFCSSSCGNLSRRGGTSWNKGLTGVQVSWNKGKKLHYEVWNKGKTLELSPELIVKKAKIIRKNVSNYWKTATEKQKEERSQKISDGLRGKKKPIDIVKAVTGNKSKFWKGETANYNSKHKWIQKHWTKTDVCEDCGLKVLPNPKTRLHHATHWANISGKYKRDRNDWKELCPKCHVIFDKNL